MLSNFKKNKKASGKKKYVLHIVGFLILCMAVFLIVTNINIHHKKKTTLSQGFKFATTNQRY